MGIVQDVRDAAEWVATALTASGYRADFTGSSVREIERFFEDHSVPGHARPGGLLAENLGARLFALGSYLGEVLRRNVGGTWQADDTDEQAEVNIALDLPDGSRVWPMMRVMKRFANGPADSLTVYGSALGLAIDLRPSVPRRPTPPLR